MKLNNGLKNVILSLRCTDVTHLLLGTHFLNGVELGEDRRTSTINMHD